MADQFYCVHTFNHGLEDFEMVGAFTKEQDAVEFANSREPGGMSRGYSIVNGYAVHRHTWDVVVGREVKARLGAMAKVFDLLLIAKAETVARTGNEITVALTADTSALQLAIDKLRAGLVSEKPVLDPEIG
jgi:hypothetical protein